MTDPAAGPPTGSGTHPTTDADRRWAVRLRRPLGLRGALAGFFVVITVVPLVSSVALLGNQVDELIAARSAQQLRAQAEGVAQLLSERSARLDDLADDLARRLAAEQVDALADGDAAALEAWLASATEERTVPERADVIALVDADGELLAARGPDAAVERVVADDAAHEAGALTARRRIRSDSAGLLGRILVAARLDDDALSGFGVDGAALLDRDGTPVASSRPGPPPEPPPEVGTVSESEQDGEQVLAVGVEVGELRLVLWSTRPERPAVLRSTAGVIVPAILLAAMLGWALAAQVAAPIGRAAATARAIADGDLDRRVVVGGPTEARELAEALNRMAGELQTRLDELHASRDALAGSLERIGRSLASSLDIDDTLQVVVESAMATLGADAAIVYLLDGDELSPTVRAGTLATGLEPVVVGRGVAGHVAQSATAARLPGRSLELDDAEPAGGARVVVPLLTGARVRGVLVVLRTDAAMAFDASDAETLRTFATQAAVALENVDRHEEAARQAVTDALTGLPNARFLGMQVDREVSTAQRYGRDLALLVADLDRFKDVNDTHGHEAGDAVLVEVARRLAVATRAPDVVARVGGEEFVVLLPTVGRAGAMASAERLRATVAASPIDLGLDGGAITVTLSIGVAVRAPDEDAAALRRRADRALYAAKRAGRDRWVLADPGSGDEPAR